MTAHSPFPVFFCLFILFMTPLSAIEFPNKIMGTPYVECLVDSLKLMVHTTAGNPSNMFVKGRHEEPTCITRNNNEITIRHETCGLTRERSLNPPGVFYRSCIVVQLHPQFITKVDRTFCASCFYMEAVKELTQELGISMLPSTDVQMSLEMPSCTYTIRRGSPTGPEIRFATVGEPVFHVWDCPSDSYGMLVQNCYVDDGQGNKILIIDQNGCGVDRYIIQTPNYNGELTMAFQESHVFKFADKTITRFTCQIKVCIKAGGTCDGITPPANCPAPEGDGGGGANGGYGGGNGGGNPPPQTGGGGYPPNGGNRPSSNGGGGFPTPNGGGGFPNGGGDVYSGGVGGGGAQPFPPAPQPAGNANGYQGGASFRARPVNGFIDPNRFRFPRAVENIRYDPAVSDMDLSRFTNQLRYFDQSMPNPNNESKNRERAMAYHSVEEDSEDTLPGDQEIIDVSGELIVLEEIDKKDMKMFTDFLKHLGNRKDAVPIEQTDSAVCIPTLGFVVIMILLSLLTLVGLVLTVALLMKNQSAAVMPLMNTLTNTLRKRRPKQFS